MKIEDQVVSLELAKKLKELGVNQESLWWWRENEEGKYVLRTDKNVLYGQTVRRIKQYSAFTVAELGEMLPWEYGTVKHIEGHFVSVKFGIGKGNYFFPDFGEDYFPPKLTEANARAKMLIYLIENKLIQR